MRYTLFCVRGNSLRPDRHFLQLGRWLPYSTDYVILQHGELTGQAAGQIMRADVIPVFMDNRYHTLTIDCPYGFNYRRRKDLTELQQFVGYLHMKHRGLYMGILYNED